MICKILLVVCTDHACEIQHLENMTKYAPDTSQVVQIFILLEVECKTSTHKTFIFKNMTHILPRREDIEALWLLVVSKQTNKDSTKGKNYYTIK